MRAALALPLVLAALAPAAAQEAPPVPAVAAWEDDIRSVFIGDTAVGLRPEEDMRQRWLALPEDRKARVKQDCDATRNGVVEGAAPDDMSVAPPAPTTGDIDQPGVLSLSELVQICGFVDRL